MSQLGQVQTFEQSVVNARFEGIAGSDENGINLSSPALCRNYFAYTGRVMWDRPPLPSWSREHDRGST